MDLLAFARGPAMQWATTIFVVGVLWRLVGILLLRTKPDLSVPRNPDKWKGLRLIALRSWPRKEFLGGTAFTEVMGYVFHIGFLVALFFYLPHVLFFTDVFRGLFFPPIRPSSEWLRRGRIPGGHATSARKRIDTASHPPPPAERRCEPPGAYSGSWARLNLPYQR